MTLLLNQSSQIAAELELRRRARVGAGKVAPQNWEDWCRVLFPNHFSRSFAQRHIEFWTWVESIQSGVKPTAFLAVWGRGGAKSTNAETAVIRLGAKGVRRYGIYVSGTQDKADGHVETIGTMLESQTFANYYSKMSRRAVNKYGASKGWRRNRLRTASGFTVDAFGLDSGLRGAKIDDARPDFIIIDDVDEPYDTLTTVLKRERILTDTVLPSGSTDCAVLAIQNLIHMDSIFSRLLDGRADFLKNRQVSGPHPAIINLVAKQDPATGRYMIQSGEATWEGQSLEICQTQIDDWGYSAFLRESQHDVEKSGGIWDTVDWMYLTLEQVMADLVKVVVWVDPAVTSTDNSDCQGLSIGAELTNKRLALLYSWEHIDTPEAVLERAIIRGLEFGASSVGVETDQGGDTWRSVYTLAWKKVRDQLISGELVLSPLPWVKLPENIQEVVMPKFRSAKAGQGHGSKIERNARMLTDYERGKVFHVIGSHSALEKALRRFPNTPLDLADSWYYCWFDTIGQKKFKLKSSST